MKIVAIQGNKEDVVIKYKKEGFNNIWIAASKWLSNNSDMSDNWLIKNGYRQLNNELFIY